MTTTVRLLGRPEITTDGHRVSVRGQKSWALLALLALSNRPISRQRVATMLFDRADDPLGALRWTLAQLRRSLGGSAELGGDPLELRRTPEVVIDVDVLANGTWVEALALPGLGETLLGRHRHRGQRRVRRVALGRAGPHRRHGRRSPERGRPQRDGRRSPRRGGPRRGSPGRAPAAGRGPPRAARPGAGHGRRRGGRPPSRRRRHPAPHRGARRRAEPDLGRGGPRAARRRRPLAVGGAGQRRSPSSMPARQPCPPGRSRPGWTACAGPCTCRPGSTIRRCRSGP